MALLRTVILYPEQFELIPKALLAAARELERIDQRSEALRLYEEIQTDHARSNEAQQAQQRRQALLKQTPD